MQTPILNCEIGDLIEYHKRWEKGKTVLAMIIGEGHRRGHERWIIQPMNCVNRKPYMIKKISTIWKKVS